MKTALLIAVPTGAILTAFAWRISELLSPDAIGMALGLAFGVLAGVPTAALVLLARRRDDDDDAATDDYIDVQPTHQAPSPTWEYAPVVYADEVTPYSHVFRRVAGMPPLPARPAPADTQTQISELEAYLDHLRSMERAKNERRFVVRWEGEAR
mgnify:CR=1 FL=1